MAVCLVAVCSFAAWWHYGGAVEPSVRGRWRATSELPHGMTREDDMDVSRSGTVRLESTIRGEGRFEASEGRWSIVTSSGERFQGTYVQPTPGRVHLRGFPFGAEVWHRHVLPDGGGPLAGRWRAEEEEAQSVTVFIVDAEGRYQFSRLTETHPTLLARGGEWRLEGDGTPPQSGAFLVTKSGELIVSLGSREVTWRRRPPTPAAVSPESTG